MFYSYNQNNSGGHFIVNAQLSRCVIIEADSLDEANRVAKAIGIYFDGVREGRDCSCCGDRWWEPSECSTRPTLYGYENDEDIRTEPWTREDKHGWKPLKFVVGPEIWVYYKGQEEPVGYWTA